MEIRIRPAAGTKVAPFELHHAYAFRASSSEYETQEEDKIVYGLQQDYAKIEEELIKRFQQGWDEVLGMYRAAREEITEGIARNLEKEAVREKSPSIDRKVEKEKNS